VFRAYGEERSESSEENDGIVTQEQQGMASLFYFTFYKETFHFCLKETMSIHTLLNDGVSHTETLDQTDIGVWT
jgi:hypothetical protein